MDRPLIVGLLGGVASGKSTVAAELESLGAKVIDADRLGHLVLRDRVVKEEIRRRWGDAVFKRSGAVDREKLADRAFSSQRDQQELVKVTHPPILKRIRAEVKKLCGRKKPVIVVLDAALLTESGLCGLCDATVFVLCDRQRRIERASGDRGWAVKEVERRERYQESVNCKRKHADYLVDNRGSRRGLAAQVRTLFNDLTCHLNKQSVSASHLRSNH